MNLSANIQTNWKQLLLRKSGTQSTSRGRREIGYNLDRTENFGIRNLDFPHVNSPRAPFFRARYTVNGGNRGTASSLGLPKRENEHDIRAFFPVEQ